MPLGQGGGPPSGGANPYHQSQIPNLAGRGGGVGAAPAGSAQMLSGTISRAAPPGSGMPQFGDLGSDGTRLSGQDGRLSAAHAQQQQQPNYMQSTLGSTTTSGRVAQLGPKGQSTPLPSGTYVGSSSQSYCSLSGGSPATNSSSASQHPHHHHPPPAFSTVRQQRDHSWGDWLVVRGQCASVSIHSTFDRVRPERWWWWRAVRAAGSQPLCCRRGCCGSEVAGDHVGCRRWRWRYGGHD